MITKKLACPSCGVGLRVADTLPAGKRIKCPKCGDAFPVPAAAPARPRKPAPPPEDDENPFEVVDDEAPAPRKRRKKPKKAAGNPALTMALVLGGATLLLGGAAVLAVTFWPTKNSGAVAANNPAPTARGAGAGSDQVAAGRQVFEANNCARCHAIGGAGGSDGGGPRGRMRGPDLASVGRDPAHTVDWLMEYVRNPLTHKPDARMPAFDGKISDSDLRALAEYLASLKQ
jgi:mono/diheme cytochrome c family protein